MLKHVLMFKEQNMQKHKIPTFQQILLLLRADRLHGEGSPCPTFSCSRSLQISGGIGLSQLLWSAKAEGLGSAWV